MTLTQEGTLRNLVQSLVTTLELAGPAQTIAVPRSHVESWLRLTLSCLPPMVEHRLQPAKEGLYATPR